MTIGHGLQQPPKPSASTINDALSLLLVFGGADKRARELLQEMRLVAEHNEGIVLEGREILARAEKMEKRLAELPEREARVERRERKIDRIIGESLALFEQE